MSVTLSYATECPKVSTVKTFISVLFSFFVSCSDRGVSKEDRSSLSEPDATEKKETENELHEAADRGAGKAFSQTEISGLRRAGSAGQVVEDDGRPGEDLVSK